MFKFLTLAFVLWACSDRANVTLPKPGLTQVPQVYVLSEKNHPLDEYFGFPSRDALGESLAARVEWDQITTLEEAAEKLRVWNARPLDLLVIAPGLPLAAWKKLSLPKSKGHEPLLLGQSEAIEGAVTVDVSTAKCEKFVERFCALKLTHAGCRVLGETALAQKYNSSAADARIVLIGAARETVLEGKPVSLNIVIDWKDFLRDQMARGNRLGTTRHVTLDFFSGQVEAQLGPAIQDKKDIEKFNQMRREFMLQELANP